MSPALLLGAVLLAATPVQAERTVGTLRDLGPALTACWRAPPETDGSEVTVRFSLKRDGSLLGQPRITYSKLVGDSGRQRAFVSAALGALAECLPVRLSESLGGTIAGRPLTIRFGARGGVTAQQDSYIPLGGYYDE
ncbi:hypothetical protein [Salinarimonas soli]|uniref:TonB C-terminal domain-containing protein n=1 Tax=Salinarimonas soli TaxID=1638099 RepID=A0A5B2W0F8_9HYPH|nr:hypothetical protein [Salinarimonas soli]KAA2243956.1 hypothetical protein F0L46_01510 [Salinarimonas soli]